MKEGIETPEVLKEEVCVPSEGSRVEVAVGVGEGMTRCLGANSTDGAPRSFTMGGWFRGGRRGHKGGKGTLGKETEGGEGGEATYRQGDAMKLLGKVRAGR